MLTVAFASCARSKLSRQCGFTLIELGVTVTLLGILFALAMPSFATWVGNSRVRSVAQALEAGVRLTQAEALRRNQDLVMTFTNDANPGLNPTAVVGGRKWFIQTTPSAFLPDTTAQPVQAGAFTDVASAVTISAVLTGTTTQVSAICFNSNGRVLGPTASTATSNCASGAVTFRVAEPSSDRPLAVMVSLGGQVRMCDPSRTLASSPDGCP